MSEDDSGVVQVDGNYTEEQVNRMKEVDNVIASLIPAEGRDYKVDYTFYDNGNLNVRFTGFTDIGMKFSKYVGSFIRDFIEKGKNNDNGREDDK